ncbi:MAG: NAD(P)-dependent oxidoreductase [Candidatus Bathyarchaeia archaeon]
MDRMAGFIQALEERDSTKAFIRVGLIGAGKMGKAIIHQANATKGVKLVALAEKELPRAYAALKELGYHRSLIESSESPAELSKAVDKGRMVLTANASNLVEIPDIDVIIDATGEVEVGAQLGYAAIMNKKNFIMMNAEADATIGPILSRLASAAGVVYTGDLGDEPGTVMNYLYEPFASMGFRVIAAGKGKNNPLNRYATPESFKDDAEARSLNPVILASFVDGTKTMVEMTVLSNATGLTPDIRGMHGPEARVGELGRIFRDKKSGGILDNEGVVDYVIGIAPGVFVVVDIPDEEVRSNLNYLKVGEGPPYVFYRPYHLPGTETILTAIWAVHYHRPVISAKGHFSDAIAIAKRDLKVGETLDGIGGYTCYGSIEKRRIVREESLLPIGLSKEAKVRRPIKRDQPLTFEDVEVKEDLLVFHLWKLQEKTLG